jgi:hypothetical protein
LRKPDLPNCIESAIVRRHPLVRFTPHRDPVPLETTEVTLPLAFQAAEGRLPHVLGSPHGRCIGQIRNDKHAEWTTLRQILQHFFYPVSASPAFAAKAEA